MFRIRIKMGPHQELQSKVWMCFFGMHVHTATIIIGLWHMFWNILALALPTIIFHNGDSITNLQNIYDSNVDMNAPALPTPLSKVNPPFPEGNRMIYYKRTFHQQSVIPLCMLSITLTMLYGAIKGKPLHLLPFFCLQVLDFAVATLMPDGYGRGTHAIQLLLSKTEHVSMSSMIPPDKFYIFVLLLFGTIVGLKAYAIGIVWRCHKYLILRQQCMRSILPLGLAELTANAYANAELANRNGRSYPNILPNYDEAVAQYLKQAPPPSYQVAMSNFLNQQEQQLQQQQQQHQLYNNINNVEMATGENNLSATANITATQNHTVVPVNSSQQLANPNGVVTLELSNDNVNHMDPVEENNNSKISTELVVDESQDQTANARLEQSSASATKKSNSSV